MKIERNIAGKTEVIELTSEEVYQAYKEQKKEFLREDVITKANDIMDSLPAYVFDNDGTLAISNEDMDMIIEDYEKHFDCNFDTNSQIYNAIKRIISEPPQP